MYKEIAKDLLIKHEGVRSKPYKDSLGILSIGIGRNLERGLRPNEIQFLFENDLEEAELIARKLVPNFDSLSDNRKAILLDMAFNLGETRLAKFKNMLLAIAKEEYQKAADQMKDSLWYRQVGNRGVELVNLMVRG